MVLIQLCAPRDAVKYFDKVKREKENIKFSSMINKCGIGEGSDKEILNSAHSLGGSDAINDNNKDNKLINMLNATDDMTMALQMEQ